MAADAVSRTKYTKAQRRCILAALAHGTVRRIEPGALEDSSGRCFRAITINLLIRDGVMAPTEYYGQFALANGAGARCAAERFAKSEAARKGAEIVPKTLPR